MKTLAAAMLVSALLITLGCKNQDKSSRPPTESTETASTPQLNLHSAVVAGDLDVIRQHIEAGTDLDEQEPTRASTPLISAAFIGNAEAARLLIDAGGFGGQHIMVLPELRSVVVFTEGNYVTFRPSFKILEEYIIPAML